MEQFTVAEQDELNKILSLGVEPFIHGDGFSVLELSLEKVTEDWLFQTYLSLPEDAQEELDILRDEGVPQRVKIHILNDLLEERQVSSAPKWWELNFFEFDLQALWEFIVSQCRKNLASEKLREFFDLLVGRYDELEEARQVLRVKKYGGTMYSDADVQRATEIFDRSYPLDFEDYDEAPRISRSPLAHIQEFIAHEISSVGTVGSRRWFEFKILDEIASYRLYVHDGARDSELSKKISAQLRGYMFKQAMSLGRMVEHYRWKFSYEYAAKKGISAERHSAVRGQRGGKKAAQKKRENLLCLIQEIEGLADLYPRVREDVIFDQAYTNAGLLRPMPKSSKTKEDYGTTLRSEEPFSSRYNAVFRKKT